MLFVELSALFEIGQFPAEIMSSDKGQPDVEFMSLIVIMAEAPFAIDSVAAAVAFV